MADPVRYDIQYSALDWPTFRPVPPRANHLWIGEVSELQICLELGGRSTFQRRVMEGSVTTQVVFTVDATFICV